LNDAAPRHPLDGFLERVRALDAEGPSVCRSQQALVRSMRAGSAGVVVLVTSYPPYLPHVGTSPTVVDVREVARAAPVPASVAEAPSITRQAALCMSSSDQVLEINAALSLNKTLLGEVFGVSRPDALRLPQR